MKSVLTTVVLFALAFPALAEQFELTATEATTTSNANPEWSDHNISDPGMTTGEGDPDEPVISSSPPNPGKKSNTRPGERVSQPEYGAGTKDSNIGVGEQSESAQRNESDLEFLRERASRVSVSATEVRGWDPEKKEAFLSSVKEHAAVRSGQDLEHFAQGALLKHDALEEIETSSTSVRMRYHVPARFLGIFETSLEEETTITFGDGEHGRSVKVKFPWYRFLFNVDNEFTKEAVESVTPEVGDEVLVSDAASSIQAILNLF